MGNALLCAAPAILLAAACLAPLLNKPYVIDDPLFLLEARQILKTPLQPRNFELCWASSEQCGQATQLLPGAALMGYALVPVIKAGGAEWLGHLMQLILASLSLIAMAALAVRLGYSRLQATLAGLLLAAMPPFLSMASTVMPDILALCLSLWGIERLAAWRADHKWHQAAAAGVLLGLAPYARPHHALLIGIGALLLCDGMKPVEWVRQFRSAPTRWMPIAIALVVTAVVFLAPREGNSAMMPAFLIASGHTQSNVAAYLIYLAVPLPFTIPWVLLNWRDWRARVLMIAAAAAGLAGLTKHYLWNNSTPLTLDRWLLLGAVLTVVALLHLLWTAVVDRNHRRMVLGLWLLVPLATVFYYHLPVKYLLATSPAIILLLLEESRQIAPRLARAGAFALVLAGTGFSIALLRADNRLAELSRQATRQLIGPYVSAGQKVWSAGQWGFYWYAAEAGAEVTRPDGPAARPGDLLVTGHLEGGDDALKRFPRRTLLRTLSETCTCGRTMGESAGLYSNLWGYSLWNWKTGEINRYELWRLE